MSVAPVLQRCEKDWVQRVKIAVLGHIAGMLPPLRADPRRAPTRSLVAIAVQLRSGLAIIASL